MATTRAQVLEHLIGTLLGQDKSSALALALKEENVTSLPDMMSLSEQDIEALRYTEKDEDSKDTKPKDVPRWAKRLLRTLQSYIYYQESEGNTDCIKFELSEYDHYRCFLYNTNFHLKI